MYVYNRYIQVEETDIQDMFAFADKDKDGRISYRNIFKYQYSSFLNQANCTRFIVTIGAITNPRQTNIRHNKP